MRILFVVGSMVRAGAEIQVKEVALELATRGHAVAIVVLLPLFEFEDELRAGGVEMHSLRMVRGIPAPTAIAKLAKFSRRFKPDLVHAHMYGAILLSRLARCLPVALRSNWGALVCTSHSSRERSRLRYAAYRLTSRLSEQWTSVSRAGLANYRAQGALGHGPAVYFPNGVNTAHFHPDPASRDLLRAALDVRGSFVWLSVGSFHTEHKDHSNLLRAFAINVKAGSLSLLLCAGEGRLLEEKRALAASLRVRDRVRFLGLRSDVAELLRAADAYVLSSQQEAMPIAVLEASASALPVVTTDVGDCSEVVKNGESGFVVPPGDSDALAKAMLRVEMLDPSSRHQMGEVARARVVAEFSLSAVVDRWEALYRQLAG